MSSRANARDVVPRRLSIADGSIVAPPPWRAVLTAATIAAAVAMWVLAIAGHSTLRSESLASHAPQASTTPLGNVFVINVDHPHLIGGGSSGSHHEAFAATVLPNSPSTALAALGLVVAVVAIAALLAQHVVLAGRGPPRGFPAALTGQDLLTRFCLSRR